VKAAYTIFSSQQASIIRNLIYIELRKCPHCVLVTNMYKTMPLERWIDTASQKTP